MDYFPFGAIRIDRKSSTFSEQRKYIGEQYDADTGLNYLNARYYNSNIGRFISQDPMFWNFDKDYLLDPQQWNSYSYARNNPIVGSDPSGEKLEIASREVDYNGKTVGAHVFYIATPDQPNEIKIQGVPEGTKMFTFGGYQSHWFPVTNKLIKDIGYEGHSTSDIPYANGERQTFNRMEIKPLEGQTDTDLINSLGKAYNDIDLTGVNYRFLGNYKGLYDGNSNNFAYTLGVNAGVKNQLDTFNPNPNNKLNATAPGYKEYLPKTSVYKQTKRALVNSYKTISNSIKYFITK